METKVFVERTSSKQNNPVSTNKADIQKDYLCPGTKFQLKNVRPIYLRKIAKLWVLRGNVRVIYA